MVCSVDHQHDGHMKTAHQSNSSAFVVAPAIPVQFTRNERSGVGNAIVALVAAGSALVGGTVSMISLVIAAVSFDGTTMFGCSDGNKYPDPAAGALFTAIGVGALVVGLGIAVLLNRHLLKSR
jgi:hypothetical protein